MPIEKIAQKKAYMQIVEQLKQMITTGEYKPGDRLPPERELSLKFGVSRPTVREALSAMEILDIIDIQVGSGAYVRKIPGRQTEGLLLDMHSEFSPTELLEARLPVEGAMAALAAIKATPEAIAEMKIIYAELVKDVQNNNYQPEKDHQLHLKIAESTKNAHFVEIINYFNQQMENKLWKAFSEQIPYRKDRLIHNHLEIIRAIEERDPDKARAMMEMHINIGLKTYFFNDDN